MQFTMIALSYFLICLTEMSARLYVACVAMHSPRRTTSRCTCVSTVARGRTSVTSVAKPSGLKVTLMFVTADPFKHTEL